MRNATFRPLDETAFNDGRQVSTAHMKRLEENAAYCREERWYTSTWAEPLYGDESSQSQYEPLKPPEFAAADWRCVGPFPVWCAESTSSATLHMVCSVADHAVEVYASTPDHITDESGAVSISPGTDQTVEVAVSKLDKGVNLLWLVIRSGRGSASAGVGNVSPQAVGDATVTKITGTGLTSPSAHTYVQDIASVGGAISISGPTEVVALSSGSVPRALFYSLLAASSSLSAVYSYGTLGSIQIQSLHLEFSNTASLGQEWPWWRWYQYPSALPGGTLLSSAAAAHARRMPSASWGAEPPYRLDIDNASFQQQAGFYLAGNDFSGSYAEIATSRVWLDQDSRSDRTRTVLVCFAMRFPGEPNARRSTDVDCDFRITLNDGSTTASEEVTVEVSTDPISDESSALDIDRRILAAVESSDTGNERVLAETVSRIPASLSSPRWVLVSAEIDASSLTAGHTIVTVEAKGTCGPWVMGPILAQQVE